jgi:hypothetical protein
LESATLTTRELHQSEVSHLADTQTLTLIPRLCNLFSPRLREKDFCLQTRTRQPAHWAHMSASAAASGSAAQHNSQSTRGYATAKAIFRVVDRFHHILRSSGAVWDHTRDDRAQERHKNAYHRVSSRIAITATKTASSSIRTIASTLQYWYIYYGG